MLHHSSNARMDTDSQRIPFSLHFGQLRASNYRGTVRGFELRPDRYSRVHAKHVSDIAAACFSFSVPPRPPGNNVIRHCRFHCDSRIAVYYLESANSAVLDCASALRHSNSATYFYWHWLVGPASINFMKYMKIHRRTHTGARLKDRSEDAGGEILNRLWHVFR